MTALRMKLFHKSICYAEIVPTDAVTDARTRARTHTHTHTHTHTRKRLIHRSWYVDIHILSGLNKRKEKQL